MQRLPFAVILRDRMSNVNSNIAARYYSTIELSLVLEDEDEDEIFLFGF